MYGGKQAMMKQFEQQQARQQMGQQLMQQKITRMKDIYNIFQENMQKYAAQYANEINKDPNFRDNFNQLCQNLGIDPMISQKTLFSNLGFGDFYNELAMKILDITARKRNENGGMMKLIDIINEFEKRYKTKISKKDIQEALKTISCLGGCQLVNNEYVSTSNLSMSGDFNSIIEVAEKYGHVSEQLMKEQKGWKQDKFKLVIDQLIGEGMVWVDKKTKSGQPHYYFPSMLNSFVDNLQEFSKYLK
ncbi:hypothetical protein ABPG74_007013 [Tetrahymena malaccensis]